MKKLLKKAKNNKGFDYLESRLKLKTGFFYD